MSSDFVNVDFNADDLSIMTKVLFYAYFLKCIK